MEVSIGELGAGCLASLNHSACNINFHDSATYIAAEVVGASLIYVE